MIPQHVRELIYGSRFYHDSFRKIVEVLPESDSELDAWLGEVALSEDPMLFTTWQLLWGSCSAGFRPGI